MKILVTGSAGFLGSYVCDKLLKEGHTVVGIDNFFRGKRANVDANDLEYIFYEKDLTINNGIIKGIFKIEKPDIVVHYGAINGTQYFYDIPYKVLDDNVRMTQNVLSACKEVKSIKKIVYASSSEIYGTPKVIPTPETEKASINPRAIRDSYAISKLLGEFYVRLFCKKNNIDKLIFRIFNTYGRRMDDSKYGQVVPEFIRKAKKGNFSMIGKGYETRAFCYVEDHVRLVYKLMMNSTGTFNVGSDKESTILELARTIHRVLGKKFDPKYLPERPNDHPRRCPDISKMKEEIDDYPKVSLKEGIEKMV